MNFKRITQIYLSGTIGILAFTNFSSQELKGSYVKQTPNIILILADDLGFGDVGCNGATKVSTPAIDQMASEGINFINAYASSSMCTPSRYSLMTGRYSWRTHLKSGVITYYDPPMIERNRTTLASMLKRNGYYTVHIGKWHLGFDWVRKDSTVKRDKRDFVDFTKPAKGGPIDRGFDYFYGMNGSNNMLPHAFIENETVGELTANEKLYDHYSPGVRSPDWKIEHVNEILTHKAVDIIDDHFTQTNNDPLFLYFATSAIHRPCLPTFTKGKSRAGMRGDLIQELDWSVDQIVQALKRNNVYDNTILIFTSDNGPRPGDPKYWINRYRDMDGYVDYREDYYEEFEAEYTMENQDEFSKAGWLTYGHKASGDYLGFKSDAWDGGFRVPFIVCWNNKIKAGTISKSMICESDLLATLSELVGDQLSPGEAEDSYSFLANITGKSAKQTRKSMILSSGGNGALVVFKGDWKFIEGVAGGGSTFYPSGPFKHENQLYNLKKDPYEKNNLYNSLPEKAAELKSEITNVEKHTVREAK